MAKAAGTIVLAMWVVPRKLYVPEEFSSGRFLIFKEELDEYY